MRSRARRRAAAARSYRISTDREGRASLASRLDARQFRRERQESPKVYYKGLNLLLNEQHDKAIDAFIEAVQQDPDTSELSIWAEFEG